MTTKNITCEQNKKNSSSRSNFVAGGLAGIIAKSAVAPIDRIKILYQVTSSPFRLVDVPRVAQTIISEEGVVALWKGNTATMLRVFPYAGLQFSTFHFLKEYRLDQLKGLESNVALLEPEFRPIDNLVAGICAGTVSVIFTYPLDLTRAQIAVSTKREHSNVWTAIRTNFRGRGFSGLYRGITPTICGIMPYSGIAFTVNEQSKARIKSSTKRDPTIPENFICGALSGLVAQSITYPLEVTRRRMQTEGLVGSQSNILNNSVSKPAFSMPRRSSSLSLNMSVIIKDIYVEQGLIGFWKGLSMNWIKGPISFGISFTSFDLIQKKLYKYG